MNSELVEVLLEVGFVATIIKLLFNKVSNDINSNSNDINIIKDEFKKTQLIIFKDFVSKEDFKDSINKLSKKLDKIFDKLERKKDKS